jgi:hypothetical protein
MAGLSTDRLRAMNEMFIKEKLYYHRLRPATISDNVEPNTTKTSIDWVGLNPDPSKYRIELLERNRQCALRHSSNRTIAYKPTDKREKAVSSLRETVESTHRFRLSARVNDISQAEISAPSTRGFLTREIYRTNMSQLSDVIS